MLQVAVVDALGALGGPEVTAPLARMLDAPHAPVEAVAGALASLDERHGNEGGGGALVAELTRGSVGAAGVKALLVALPTAGDRERVALTRVLGWLDDERIDDVLVAALGDAATCEVASDALVRRGARAVEPLLAALGTSGVVEAEGDSDADYLMRGTIAAVLGRLGAASAVPALVTLLGDAPEVAVVAAGALGHIGDRRAVEPLVAALDDPHAALRQASVSALNSLGHDELGARLPALLRDPSARVREAGAKVAGYLGDPAMLDAMLELRGDADEAVRRAAVEQLARFEDERASAAIADALAGGTPGVRAAAARALAHGDPREAIALAELACTDADPWVRYYGARSLLGVGRHARIDAVRLLLKLAEHDTVPPVRIAALDALATLGEASELAPLRALADDPDPSVAAAALSALGAGRDRETLDPLLAALGQAERVRRLAALDALRRRRDADAVPVVAALARRTGDEEERRLALRVLAATPDQRAAAAIVDLAREPKRGASVVAALTTLPEEHVAWLRAALADGDVHVRSTVVDALGRMHHRGASALLAEALHDEHRGVQAAAAYALARADLRATTG
jgi:HEAT repeat protein